RAWAEKPGGSIRAGVCCDWSCSDRCRSFQVASGKYSGGSQQNDGDVEQRVERILRDESCGNFIAVGGRGDAVEIVEIRKQVIEHARQLEERRILCHQPEVTDVLRKYAGDVDAQRKQRRKHRAGEAGEE